MDVEFFRFLIMASYTVTGAALMSGALIMFASFFHRSIVTLTIGFVLTTLALSMVIPLSKIGAAIETPGSFITLMCIASGLVAALYVSRCIRIARMNKQETASKASEATTADATK